MPKCCSPARARAKIKATKKANRLAAQGRHAKKANPKKTQGKKAAAKKASPCKLCGRFAK